MRTNNTYKNWILSGLLVVTAFVSSCSENVVEPIHQQDNDIKTVTFEVGIDDASITTRAKNGYEKAEYVASVYVFSKDEFNRVSSRESESAYAGYKLEGSEKLESSLFTWNIKTNKDYLFIFVACEKAYEEDCIVKYAVANEGGNLEDKGNVSVGTEYINCFISVFSNDAEFTFPLKPNVKKDAYDDFMIYGAAHPINGIIEGNYKPEKIILTRQLGAVTFKAAESTEKVTCNIVSDYYRLYLSQIAERNSSDYSSYSYIGDYASVGYKNPQITKEFPNGGNGEYTIYLPYTTTHTPEEFIAEKDNKQYCWDQRANYYKLPDVSEYGISPTSINVNGENYSLTLDKNRFPIFPNYRTILKVDDGSGITVSFGKEGGIDLEDQWNGWSGM